MTDPARLPTALAYAGTLPFVGCALLPLLGIPVIPGVGPCTDIAAAYGLAIAAFMAGVHWGTHLYQAARAPLNLLLTSNIVTVIVWLGFVLAPAAASLVITGGAFLALLLIDEKLARIKLLTHAYMRMRRFATAIVVLMLALTYAAS